MSAMMGFFKRALRPFALLVISTPLLLFAQNRFILVNDGIMPPKEVKKIEQMGQELYEKTKIPVFVAAVADLNKTRPVDLLENIKKDYPTYILLYFSTKPMAVNIFASDDARKLIDIDQILSPLPWRGTIRPVMSPAFSKNENVKYEVALFNGYADIVDQIAKSMGVELESSVGSKSRTTFQIVRAIFYTIFAFVLLQFIIKRKKRAKE
ncbi:hypothetical protein [Hydrogenimonas sp.]